MMLAPIDTADKIYSIDPSATAVGAVGVDNWAGFTSPAQSVFSNGGLKYVGSNSDDLWYTTAFVTKASGRDQEISFKVAQTYQGCIVYLRWDGETSVRLTVSKGGNTFKAEFIRYTGLINQTYGTGTDTVVDSAMGVPTGGLSLSSLVGTTFSATDVWTFGAYNDTFYAKFNGTTFWSTRFWTQARSGKIAVLHETPAAVGYRDVTCTFKPSAVSYSDFDNLVLDPRDWGLKDRSTTGSMTAGSYTLTVADSTGFNVGDSIIVETGGEAGAGYFGTEGVGGTWPTYSYADQSELPNAATYRATDNPTDTDLFVWLRDTNKVWINYKNAGVPTWGEFSPATVDYYYYHNEVQPRALCTTITTKSGNTLTLAAPAVVATTNANVYIDSTPAWLAIWAGNACIGTLASSFGAVHPDWYSVREHVTIKFPPGRFAMRKYYQTIQTRYWTVEGETRDSTILHTPMGGSDFCVTHSGSHNTYRNMTLEGNVIEHRGFCHDTDRFYKNIEIAIMMVGNRQSGINGEEYCEVNNVKFVNTFGGAVLALTHYSKVKNCIGIQNQGNLQRYLTWFFGHAYCIDSWVEDCSYTADKLGTAFEVFQCEGGGFKNVHSVNGYFSSNFGGGNYKFENITALIDLNDMPTVRDWMKDNAAVINININIGGGAQTPEVLLQGGSIINPYVQITQRQSDGLLRSGVVINTGAVNMRITGTHPTKPGSGHFKFIRSGATPVYGEWCGIGSTEKSTITGIRVEGLDNIVSNYGGIYNHVQDAETDEPRVKNCVADNIQIYNRATSSFSQAVGTSGNITNTAYEAL